MPFNLVRPIPWESCHPVTGLVVSEVSVMSPDNREPTAVWDMCCLAKDLGVQASRVSTVLLAAGSKCPLCRVLAPVDGVRQHVHLHAVAITPITKSETFRLRLIKTGFQCDEKTVVLEDPRKKYRPLIVFRAVRDKVDVFVIVEYGQPIFNVEMPPGEVLMPPSFEDAAEPETDDVIDKEGISR